MYQRLPELKEYEQDCALISVQNGVLAAVRAQKPDVFFTSLPLPNDSTVTLRLVRRNPLAFDTKPTITTEHGTIPIKQSLLPVLYAGKVLGDEESIASLCFTSEEVFGIITLHGQTYNIGRVRQSDGSAQADVYTVSNDKVLPRNAQLPQCAVSEHDIMQQSKEILSTLADISNGKNSASLQSDKRLRVEVAVEVDYAMYQQFNNSVERASAYATSLIATVSQIFERDLNVELSISYLNVWTSQDPYKGDRADIVSYAFDDYWKRNRTNVKRSIAQLLSSRSLGGGIASTNVLCSTTDGYSVVGNLRILDRVIPIPTYSYEVTAVAHELGHNFGSPHTHSCLWPGGAIDSCVTAQYGDCFTTPRPSIGTIMSYCNSGGGSIVMGFHPLCSQLMRTRAERASCTVVVPDNQVVTSPTLVTPAYRAILPSITQNVSFSWTGSAGSMSYRLQVATNEFFTTTPIVDTVVVQPNILVRGLPPNTLLYWRVTAQGNAKLFTSTTSSFSVGILCTEQVLQTPITTTPQNGTALETGSASIPFTWSGILCATSYRLQIATDERFSTITSGSGFGGNNGQSYIIRDTVVSQASATISGLPANKRLFWRVQARRDNTTSPFSSTFNFTLGTLTQPQLSVAPLAVSFVNVSIGQASERTITIAAPAATGNVNVSLSLESQTEGFSITSTVGGVFYATTFALTPGTSRSLPVRFSPTRAGEARTNLIVRSDLSTTPLSVALSGSAVSGMQSTGTSVVLANVNMDNQQAVWQLDRTTPRDSGFVHGTNLYLHRAKATAVRLPTGQRQAQLSQVSVWFAYKRPGLTNQTYRVEVYSGTAQTGPQSLIASRDYILAGAAAGNVDMVNISLPVIPTVHTFTPMVTVGESFFVGVNFGQYGVSGISDAGIAASNLLGRRVAEDWEMGLEGRWTNMSDAWFPQSQPNGWNMWLAAGVQLTTTFVREEASKFQLSYYPNPCSEFTTIQYTLSQASQIQIELYSILGVRLATLVQEPQAAGNYVVPVDVRTYPSGQYYYRLGVNGEWVTRSLQVVR